MENNAQKIAEQIKRLLDELVTMSGGISAKKQKTQKAKTTSVPNF